MRHPGRHEGDIGGMIISAHELHGVLVSVGDPEHPSTRSDLLDFVASVPSEIRYSGRQSDTIRAAHVAMRKPLADQGRRHAPRLLGRERSPCLESVNPI